MACVLLHNLCIARQDPCNPRWKLHVDEPSLVFVLFCFVFFGTFLLATHSNFFVLNFKLGVQTNYPLA